MSTATNDRPATTTPANVAAMFFGRVRKSPDTEAFRKLDGDRWVSVTWQEAGEQVEQLAAGLLALGIQPEQRIGIASSTRYEWILADLAIITAIAYLVRDRRTDQSSPSAATNRSMALNEMPSCPYERYCCDVHELRQDPGAGCPSQR